jgi:hypothetical protein
MVDYGKVLILQRIGHIAIVPSGSPGSFIRLWFTRLILFLNFSCGYGVVLSEIVRLCPGYKMG